MPYVYSKLASDNSYTGWKPNAGSKAPNQKEESVLVKGGAGVANKNLVTPQGVVTKVTDEQAEFLMKNAMFLRHSKRGFVVIEQKEVEVEKVVDDMTEERDKSDQLNDTDFEAEGTAPPVTNTEKKPNNKKKSGKADPKKK